MYQLRSECTKTCTSVESFCSAAFPQLSAGTDEFFDACESKCCSSVYPLSVAFFIVLGVAVVLAVVFLVMLFRIRQEERRLAAIAAQVALKPQVHHVFDEGRDVAGTEDENLYDDVHLGLNELPTGGPHPASTTSHVVELSAPPVAPWALLSHQSSRGEVPAPPRRSIVYDGDVSIGFH
eukprot:CAMPEP_0176418094 /NCGR_PEP_ID=MMETSP0127-20121128/7263_1 /TAXON_ID=938130 /ORGANISM="Platyophrya macrostoma, Strain WH" /LENGTH=178 /DNA_ID=CAMNT_0017798347 /DNA_START=105 /DNA_END=638 /DNA_ORIENTATION=-